MARGAIFKILFFASVEIRRAETSGLAKRITALSCSIIIKIWDIPESKLGVISTAKTAHNQGANNESPKLHNKSYFARHFYAVLKLWVTGKCMCNIKSIGSFNFARLYCFLENCWNCLLERSQTRGGLRIWKGWDARRKFGIKPLKETDLGVAQAFFFWTPKRDHVKIQTIYLSGFVKTWLKKVHFNYLTSKWNGKQLKVTKWQHYCWQ